MLRGLQPENSESIIQKQEEIIESSRALFFAKEPMIQYLLDRLLTEFNIAHTEKSAYQIFESSKNLEDFLENLGFTPNFIDKFILDFEQKANRDFQKKRRKNIPIQILVTPRQKLSTQLLN